MRSRVRRSGRPRSDPSSRSGRVREKPVLRQKQATVGFAVIAIVVLIVAYFVLR